MNPATQPCGHCGGPLDDDPMTVEWTTRHGFCCADCEFVHAHFLHTQRGEFDPYCELCAEDES